MTSQLTRSSGLYLVVAFFVAIAGTLFAQPANLERLTLAAAVDLAVHNYPALLESRARAEAANATVAVAETAYLPRLDALLQVNRATHNNVFGLLLPQAIIPSISGPVLGTRGADSVWGTAGGVLLSWDAVDFGVRKANVDVARRQTDAARAQAALTELDVAAAAADAFLTVLAADESVRAAQANIDRLQVFTTNVRTLVQNQLRPGADQSRAQAELAVANNQLSQAVQIVEVARASLADAVGSAGTSFELAAGSLAAVPQFTIEAADLRTHPAARAGQAADDVVRARPRPPPGRHAPRDALSS